MTMITLIVICLVLFGAAATRSILLFLFGAFAIVVFLLLIMGA